MTSRFCILTSKFFSLEIMTSWKFRSIENPGPNPLADQSHEQCSHTTLLCPSAKRRKEESPQDFQAWQENRSIKLETAVHFVSTINPSLTQHLRKSFSKAPTDSGTQQEQWSYSAHVTEPQTRQAPTKHAPMGVCKISSSQWTTARHGL